ncbi:MAG: SDR family oxidoreductase [Balneolaceae bacterium]
MKISIVGAAGQIARKLHPLLIDDSHQVRGLIRKKEQMDELAKIGVEPILCDIEYENDIAQAVGRADVVVFAAGAGPGSGAERKWTVDRDGAIKLIEAAKKIGPKRYIMISAMGLDKPRGSDVFKVYQKAKAEADEALRKSGLPYVILKPGRLTNEPGNGNIQLQPSLERGEISREDVAATLFHIIQTSTLYNVTLDLVQGDQPIKTAVNKAVEFTA